MRFQHILFILTISIVFAGCASCEEQTPISNNNNSTPIINQQTTKSDNTNLNVNNQDNTNGINTDTNKKDPDPILGGLDDVPKEEKKVEAVTLKPTLLAFCEAMRKKDSDGLRKVYSAASIKKIEKDMKEEEIETIAEFLDLEPVGNTCELINENIQGLTGEATVITETYPKGTSFKFVKENNEWKITNESSDINRVLNK